MIHLDTNFLVRGMVPGSNEAGKIAAWLLAGEEVEMSAVAWGECVCGPVPALEEAAARALIQRIHPLGKEDAELAAQLFNRTGRRSRNFADCMIAAVAIRQGASIATSNAVDFSRFEPHGLKLA